MGINSKIIKFTYYTAGNNLYGSPISFSINFCKNDYSENKRKSIKNTLVVLGTLKFQKSNTSQWIN